MRQAATSAIKRDLDHGDLICFAEAYEHVARLRHEGRLDDNDVTPGEQFRRLSEQQHRKAAIVFATVKGDALACRS